MDRAMLAAKIVWNLQERWHLRHTPTAHELSIQDTVRGLQQLLLGAQGALLAHTLQQALARPVPWQALAKLEISLYQEGMDQRVWRGLATLTDGTMQPFGMIVARAPGASSTLTEHDFHHLHTLSTRHARYCVRPYVLGTMAIAGGIPAYTVEWLEHHKELVFEITRDGGVFLVNAPGAQRYCSPQESRQIWRHLVEILWWYPDLRRVNVQAGDFIGLQHPDGRMALKLTTARELVPAAPPAATLHAILRSVITASGYLSNGQQPFDRRMPHTVFLHRMHAVLQRRFGPRAASLAQQQWELLQQGVLARQEDWLKEDCILATYDRLRAEYPAAQAWQETCQYWSQYARAVQSGSLPPSWWFPTAEIPHLLQRLAPAASQEGTRPPVSPGSPAPQEGDAHVV